MKNATHETLGASAALAVCAVAGVDALTTCAAVAASLLGSRLPDADQAGSKIHRRTRLERRSVALSVVGFVLRLPLRLFAAIADHRGATHWLSTTVAVSAACGAIAAAIHTALIVPVTAGIA
ncbi:MAG: metal-dependent hydrolase, partial [Vicinamibacteria bacterium]